MTSAYRSAAYDHVVGEKLAEVEEANAQVRPHLRALRDVSHARLARVLGGTAGLAGGAAMAYAAATTNDASATDAMLVGSLAIPVTWVAAKAVLRIWNRFQRAATPEIALVGDLKTDLDAIERGDARKETAKLEASAAKLEVASVALPIAGITCLMPLLLHWLFLNCFGRETNSGFAEWIRISLVIVGHAHVALALCGYFFAKKLKAMHLDELATMKIHREWTKAWLITIGVSCLPGIILILVPPILVAITAIAFVPFMWTLLHRSVVQERCRFAAAEYVPPIQAPLIRVEENAPLVRIPLAEEQQSEPDCNDEHAGADTHDRAQA
jgi:hypothetical protein